MEETKPKRGRPRKEVTTTPKPAKAKKGNQGRKPSGLKFTSLVIDVLTRDRLRKLGDYLAARAGETFTLRRTIDWLLNGYDNLDEIETPDGE